MQGGESNSKNLHMEDLYKQFPDLHPNIVLKTDILRLGINISQGAMQNFKQRDDLLWKGFHLFSYDYQKTAVYGEKVPYILYLEDGAPIQVRTNIESPYLLDLQDGHFAIKRNNEIVANNIFFERKPKWYDMRTEKEGVLMGAIAQGHCRSLFVTINKYCEMWKTDDQCLFCDINTTLKDQKRGGEDSVARMGPETIAEVIQTAIHVDRHYAVGLYVSGGTILKKYRGQTELDFYCTRLNAIREKLGTWIPTTVQIAPYDDEGLKRLHDTGFASLQPNIEVWDKRLFQWICPGKDKFIGYDEWIRRTIRAVDFWGPGQVNPNFVLGVEMAKPYGFETVNEAVKSTSEGWDFLMSHGALPRFNIWTREAGSAFSGQLSPPLEYFLEIQKAYTELRWKHKFDPPFPAAKTRDSWFINCLWDFEYYHGTGPLSKKSLDARLGVQPKDKGGRYNGEGYTLS
jgi:hypothetical protein